MRKITFDIETQNTFEEAGSSDPADLSISLLVIHDSKSDTYTTFYENTLQTLWPIIEEADMLIGFNSDHFDIPLLNKYYPGDLQTIKSLDLLKEIKNAIGRRIRLDYVAEGTLGTKKSGHGLDAITWWKEGALDKIEKYCIDDVRITKELYDYARKNNLLKFKEGPSIVDVPLDTSTWEEMEETSMTHTLPF